MVKWSKFCVPGQARSVRAGVAWARFHPGKGRADQSCFLISRPVGVAKPCIERMRLSSHQPYS